MEIFQHLINGGADHTAQAFACLLTFGHSIDPSREGEDIIEIEDKMTDSQLKRWRKKKQGK